MGGRTRRGWAGRGAASRAVWVWEGPWANRPGRGRPLHTPAWVCMGIPGMQGVRPAAFSLATGNSAGVRSGLGCPSGGLRAPLLALTRSLAASLGDYLRLGVSDSVSTHPPRPRRRVPGGGAPRAAPAQRGAAPAEAAGPPARLAEPLLLCHPGGERIAAPEHEPAASVLLLVTPSPGTTPPSSAGGGPPWGARASAPGFFGSCSFLGPRVPRAGRILGWEGLRAWTPVLKEGGGWRLPDAAASLPGV